MNIHLTLKSRNVKTGKIPVSTTSAESCPSDCPFKNNGCYAAAGHVGMFWHKVTNGLTGGNIDSFCKQIEALPTGQLWRHNQAGDLIGRNGQLNATSINKLVKANQGKRGFTYTHYNVIDNPTNKKIVKKCNDNGFTVNLSGNNLSHADDLADLGIGPVVTVLPMDAESTTFTPKGRRVVVCPAVLSDDITCKSCGLCEKQNRKVIVGFPAHGTSKKKASLIAMEGV